MQELADGGLLVVQPPEDWLFKVFVDDALVDVIFRPAGTFADRAVVERLAQEVRKVMAKPDVQAQLAAQGLDPVTSDPESFKVQIDRELNRWTRDIKTMNIGLN